MRALGQKGSEPGRFQHPYCFTLNREELWVADCNNHRIQVLRADTGASVRVFGVNGPGPGKLNAPYGIAIAEKTGEVSCLAILYRTYENIWEAGWDPSDCSALLIFSCSILTPGVCVGARQQPRLCLLPFWRLSPLLWKKWCWGRRVQESRWNLPQS